jgi:hypothetical protein
MKLCRLATFFALVAASSVGFASLKTLQFTKDDPQALVLIEEAEGMFNGSVLFVEVDLTSMTVGKRKFSIGKDALNGRLPTKNKGLQTKGEYVLWKLAVSRFSGNRRPAGDFALVKYTGPRGPFGQSYGCLPDGAPVYRFKPGVANLISADMVPSNGGSFPILTHPEYARNGSNDDLPDAQSVLDENPGVKAKVVFAEILALVQFRDKKGKAVDCGEGISITTAPAI